MKKSLIFTISTLCLCLCTMFGLVACDINEKEEVSPKVTITAVRGLSKSYTYGGSVDYTNAKIEIINAEGQEEIIDLTSNMVKNLDTTLPGNNTARIIYKGTSFDFDYEVDLELADAKAFMKQADDNLQVIKYCKIEMATGPYDYGGTIYYRNDGSDLFCYCVNPAGFELWAGYEGDDFYSYLTSDNTKQYIGSRSSMSVRDILSGIGIGVHTNSYEDTTFKQVDVAGNLVTIQTTEGSANYSYRFEKKNIDGRAMYLPQFTFQSDTSGGGYCTQNYEYSFDMSNFEEIADIRWKNTKPTEALGLYSYGKPGQGESYLALSFVENEEINMNYIYVKANTVSAGVQYLDYSYVKFLGAFDTSSVGTKYIMVELAGKQYVLSYTVTES